MNGIAPDRHRRSGLSNLQANRPSQWTAGPGLSNTSRTAPPTNEARQPGSSHHRQHYPGCRCQNRRVGNNYTTGGYRTRGPSPTPRRDYSDLEEGQTYYRRYHTTHHHSSTTTEEVTRRGAAAFPRTSEHRTSNATNPVTPAAARITRPTRNIERAQSPPWPLRLNTGNDNNIVNGRNLRTSTPIPHETPTRNRATITRQLRLSPSEEWRRLVNRGSPPANPPLDNEPTLGPATERVSPYFSTPPTGRRM